MHASSEEASTQAAFFSIAWHCVFQEQPARLQLHESTFPAHFSAEVEATARTAVQTMKAHIISLDTNLQCTTQLNTKPRSCAGPVERPSSPARPRSRVLTESATRWSAAAMAVRCEEQLPQVSAEGSPRLTAWGRTIRPDPGVSNRIWTVHRLSRKSSSSGEDSVPFDRGWYSSGVEARFHLAHGWREEKPASQAVDGVERIATRNG